MAELIGGELTTVSITRSDEHGDAFRTELPCDFVSYALVRSGHERNAFISRHLAFLSL